MASNVEILEDEGIVVANDLTQAEKDTVNSYTALEVEFLKHMYEKYGGPASDTAKPNIIV